MWQRCPLLMTTLACGCAALRAGIWLFQSCQRDVVLLYCPSTWCTFWEWGLGGKPMLSCRPWKKDVSGGQSLENLSNIQWLLQGTKAASLLQIPAVLFFQQEEWVPHGFFSVLKAADSTTDLGNRTVSKMVLFYSERGSWKQRFAVLGDFHAPPPVWRKRFHPK